VQEQVARFLNYLKIEQVYSDNTIAAYRNDLNQFVAFLNHASDGLTSSWTEVDHQLIQAYGEHLDRRVRENIYTPSTVARKIASVKSFFSYMSGADLLGDNPTVALSTPKVEKRTPRILSLEEVESLLAEPAKVSTPKALRDKALLELLYATGMRVSEIIALQMTNLDMAQEYIRSIGGADPTRQLSLSPRASRSLLAYLDHGRSALTKDPREQTVFLNQRGHPLTRQGLWLIIKSYAEGAGIAPGFTPHTLRHSCAVHRLAQGADLHEIRELLGHANISSTQIYKDIVNQPDGELIPTRPADGN